MRTLARCACASCARESIALLLIELEADFIAGRELREVSIRELVAIAHAAAVLVQGLGARCSARRVADASPLGAVGTAGVVAAAAGLLDLDGLNAHQTAATGLLASSDVR